MDTLHLVAPEYREAAEAIPIFDMDSQPIAEIRAALVQAYEQKYGASAEVAKEHVVIETSASGPPVDALLYRPASGQTRGTILHMHGGGWIAGTAAMMAGFCRDIADRHHAAVLSVDYRLVPDVPGGAALDDCFSALSWLRREAGRIGASPDRVIVMGDSAGATLAAGVALRVRDAGLQLGGQVLLYPALDDRTGGPNAMADNPYAGEFVLPRPYLGQLWTARLARTTTDQLRYLAPSRMEDLAGLAPVFVAVGSLDLLVDEAMDFSARLGRAGVQFQLHVYQGAFHAFDLLPGQTTDRLAGDLNVALESFLATSGPGTDT